MPKVKIKKSQPVLTCKNRLVILIPAYNEARVIRNVLRSLPKKMSGIHEIKTVLINDGSNDDTAKLGASVPGTHVVSHQINLGVGAAMMTGIEAARRLDADIAVTIDADGQHDPNEIARVIKPILTHKADIVIGNRFMDKKSTIPSHRVTLNRIANFLTNWLYNTNTGDSQSGFRAYSRKAIEKLRIDVNGFEVCSELLGQADRLNLKVAEVPITVYYTDYSLSKGQSLANSLTMGLTLVFNALRRRNQ